MTRDKNQKISLDPQYLLLIFLHKRELIFLFIISIYKFRYGSLWTQPRIF